MNWQTKQTRKITGYYLKRLLKSWYFCFFALAAIIYWVIYPLLNWKTKHPTISFPAYLNQWKIFDNLFSNWANLSKEKGIFGFAWELALNKVLAYPIISLGYGFSFLIVNSSINRLVTEAQINGEDKTILAVASPIKREILAWAKIGAFLLFYYLVSFLFFTLPLVIYYFVSGNFVTSLGISFFLLDSLLFPLIIFLLFYAWLFWLGLLNGTRKIGGLIIGFSLTAILLLLMKFKFKSDLLREIQHNPLVIIGLSLVIGCLFLFLYYKKFRKNEFS